MEIMHIKYIVSIVENKYNITRAAESLFISQPGLSKALASIEDSLGFEIFKRKRGRLLGLTSRGEIIYDYSKEILYQYNWMMKEIDQLTSKENREITIGVPPVVVTIMQKFFDLINQLSHRPNVKFVEIGAHNLESLLDNQKIDFAVLLNTPKVYDNNYQAVLIRSEEFAIFLDEKNPLSNKTFIEFSDLENAEVLLADKTHETHHIFMSMLDSNNAKVKSIITDYTWSYSFTMVKNSNIVAFLPIILKNFLNMEGIKAIKFKNRIPWDVYFVWRKKRDYSEQEHAIIDLIVSKYGSND